LEFLRRCLPARIRQALDELPESLDGTYERVLQDIDKANWIFAHRIFQCVAVSSRPLRVEELSEFLAFDFDAGPTPTYQPSWRPDDPLSAVLSTCSSLLAIVETGNSKVIQFSHFSVKEFLTSIRLAEARDPISRYHVSITSANSLVAQACLGILLHLDKDITNDGLKNFPLAEYAAQHWVDHARLENMSINTQAGIKHLFDPRMRHLAIWVWIYNPEGPPSPLQRSGRPARPGGSCLHYAALLDLHNLITFLVVECSQGVNSRGFNSNQAPLHVAVENKHKAFAQVLLEHGAGVGAQDNDQSTPLHLASRNGHVELAQLLVEHGAEPNAEDYFRSTPLHLASNAGHVELAQLLVERGAELNALDVYKSTPLHLASKFGYVESARLLVERGANVNIRGNYQTTPLHFALKRGHVDMAQLLVEHGAELDARENDELTPLHIAILIRHVELAWLLIKNGAEVDVRDQHRSTPLHLASKGGYVEFVRLLTKYGAKVNAQNNDEMTPLHIASVGGHVNFARLLVEHGAQVNARDGGNSTPLHLASKCGQVGFTRLFVGMALTYMPRTIAFPHISPRGADMWNSLDCSLNMARTGTPRTITSRLRCISHRNADMWNLLSCLSSMART
jgi:ankyrin repeat protein